MKQGFHNSLKDLITSIIKMSEQILCLQASLNNVLLLSTLCSNRVIIYVVQRSDFHLSCWRMLGANSIASNF